MRKVLISFLFIFSGCHSLNYGAGSLGSWIGGSPVYIVKKPLEAVFTKGTDDFYEDLQESIAKEQKRSQIRSIVSCSPDSIPQPQKNCLGCVPWGSIYTCEEVNKMKDQPLIKIYQRIFGENASYILKNHPNLKNVCCEKSCEDRCDLLCPDSPTILAKRKSKQNTYIENLLPVTNNGEFYTYPEEHRSWKKPVKWGGVCNGHSTIRRRIASLAMFPPGPVHWGGMSKEEQDSYYENILKDLISGKVREVPGYTNIYDFLSRPHLAPILRKGILAEFHKQSFTNPFHFESRTVLSAFDDESFEKTMQEIQQNLEISGTSQITYGYDSGGGHTVEVFHSYQAMVGKPSSRNQKEKATILCAIDSNDRVCELDPSKEHAPCTKNSRSIIYRASEKDSPSLPNFAPLDNYSPDKVYCPNKFIVFEDKSYVYFNNTISHSGMYTLQDLNVHSSFKVDSHQARNTSEIISALKDYCLEKRGCNDPAPYTEKQQKADGRAIENLERNLDRTWEMTQRAGTL